ncbi:MAG: VWA domain-containing protein [Bacteroidia bacterium]|nr:VWA domain-containing protein [Bacteroidia bacterium]
MQELDFNYSPWFILLIAVLAAAISWFMYRATKDLLPAGWRWFLAGFRWLVLTILGILLLEPLLNSISEIKYPPIVAVVQDNSESISIQKDSAFVRKEYPQLLNQFLGNFEQEKYITQLFTFSDHLKSESSLDSLKFDRTGTNISGALDELKKLYTNQNLGAVVLVSDGIATSGVNPLYEVDDWSIPVYTVLLGDTTEQKDVRITEVLFNDIAYLDKETPIKVKIRAEGYDGKKLTIKLDHKGKTLDTREVTLGQGQTSAEVDFSVTPKEVGLQQFGIHVTEFPDEITRRNNHKLIFINVLETRVKVAIFAGSPHPDLGALRQAFARDDRYEVFEFAHKDRTSFYESPDKYNFPDFDLAILHNFPYSPKDAPILEKLLKEVKDRNLPLMNFMGIFTDLKTAQPLYEYIGVSPTVQTDGFEEAQINFTMDYMEHSSFTFDREWLRLMNNAPPLLRNRSDWKAKGDAEVYGRATIRNIQLDYPLFVVQQHLGRKNITLVGENFWRMRSHVFVENGDFDAFDQWVHNLVQWLVVREDKRKFKVAPSKQLFTGNELITFKGQVYDDSYNPVKGAEIKLKVTDPGGKENVYYLSESGEARYYLEMSNLEEGTYSYQAEGKRGEVKLGTDQGQFSVGKSNVEHFRLRADDGLLQQMALRTDAKYTLARDLPGLASQIKALGHLKTVSEEKKSRMGLHELVWIFGLIVLLLTVEWVVRKVFSLV